jgi:hypothetical protein
MRCVWRIGVIITIVSLLMGATRPARSDPLLPDALASTFRRGAPGADIVVARRTEQRRLYAQAAARCRRLPL